MALSIRSPQVERLARRLAAERGETITDTILGALEERLKTKDGPSPETIAKQRLENAALILRQMPDQSIGTADELLGYDEIGLPR